jgi:hypothetical protein
MPQTSRSTQAKPIEDKYFIFPMLPGLSSDGMPFLHPGLSCLFDITIITRSTKVLHVDYILDYVNAKELSI